MLRRLPITFWQIKASKASKNLLNEIWEIMYSFLLIKQNYWKNEKQNHELNKVIIQNR